MVKLLFPNFSANRCNAFRILLAFSWVLGLLLGTGVSFAIHDDLSYVLSVAIKAKVSITGFVFAMVVPFLLSFLCASISSDYLLLLVFFKSFIFSFVYVSCFLTFEASAWLVCFLFMFTDLFSFPFLWLIWLRSISERQDAVIQASILSLIAFFLICCVDYSYVAPFLEKLV